MSGFSFSSDEPEIKEVWSCTDCIYCSTKHHFRDGPRCPLCNSEAEKIGEQEEQTGMASYKYQEYLTYLEDEVTGVGSGTVSSVKEHFEDGDDFITATKNAYDNRVIEELTCVDGVGEGTAEKIARGIAEKNGWEDGLLESKYALSA